MRLARFATRSLNEVAFLQPFRPFVSRTLSTNAEDLSRSSLESSENFDLFGDYKTNDEKSSGFFQHLGNAEKDKRHSYGFNRPHGSGFGSMFSAGGSMNRDERFDPSSDGVDGKLKEASLLFNFDEGESMKDSYSFRSDDNLRGLNNYYPRDLNFKRPMQKPRQSNKPEITTKEVLSKADFRNVRFLEQFITEAGIIIKRKQTGISAKAQRKIAREIKTARAFGLMPFTTMGTKAFTFGKTMENRDQDFEYEVLDDDDEFDNEIA